MGFVPCWGDSPSPSGCPSVAFALQGAFWGLMAGLALGLARMGLELAYPSPRCGVPDRRPWLLADLHYLHFAVLLCAATGAVVVGGSLLSPPPSPDKVSSARGRPGPLAPDPLGWRRRWHPGLCPELGRGGPGGVFSPNLIRFQLRDLTWWSLPWKPPQPSVDGTSQGPLDGECVLRGILHGQHPRCPHGASVSPWSPVPLLTISLCQAPAHPPRAASSHQRLRDPRL